MNYHPSATPLVVYLERMDGIRARFDAVIERRLREADHDRQVAILAGYMVAKVQLCFKVTDDLYVWMNAHRALGGAI